MTLRTPDHARLTPAAVHAMSFRVARLGRRGLDEEDVQDFCERVEDELARLLEERARLYAEVRRLRGRPPSRNRAGAAPAMPLSAPVAAPARELPPGRPGPQEPSGQAVHILAQAQQTAERCVADARAYSREVAHDAQRRRERILAEASARAAVLLEQAHRAATRAALGRPAPDPDPLTSASPAACADPLPYRDQETQAGREPYAGRETRVDGDRYAGSAAETRADPVVPGPRPGYSGSEYPGSAGDERVPATDYPRPSADSRLAADYPGPASDYPGNPARYRDAGGRRRIPVTYDRFPF
ncbi:MAG TPA: DivIVA domain-containing protein [Streptosporangiaceae bacterium]